MSAQTKTRRLTAVDIAGRKGGDKVVSLTAYHAHTAGIVDQYCDFILVGDSLGMVMHGLETTIPVTLEMMILQGHAVMRGSKKALVVVDMPFGSYEENPEQAFRNASRILKETMAGCPYSWLASTTRSSPSRSTRSPTSPNTVAASKSASVRCSPSTT